VDDHALDHRSATPEKARLLVRFENLCTSEDEAQFVANGIKQDELKVGSIVDAG
jgi:hypothetical protein